MRQSRTVSIGLNRFKNEVQFFSESFINLEAPSLKTGEENGMFKFDVK